MTRIFPRKIQGKSGSVAPPFPKKQKAHPQSSLGIQGLQIPGRFDAGGEGFPRGEKIRISTCLWIIASLYVSPLLLADNVSIHCVFCVPFPCLLKRRTCRSNSYSSIEFVENSPSAKGKILLFKKMSTIFPPISSSKKKRRQSKNCPNQLSNPRSPDPKFQNSKKLSLPVEAYENLT